MKSFTFRLTRRFALLVTTTVTVVLALGGFLLHRQTFRALDVAHEAEAVELAGLLGDRPGQTAAEIRERLERDADSDDALYFIQVNDAHGEVFFRSGNMGAAILPPPNGGPTHRDINLPALGDLRLSSLHHGQWHILVASFLEPSRKLLRVYVEVSVALLIGAALVSVALGYGFSRMTLRPIRAIEATARRIGSGNLHERIPVPPGRDELVALTVLLNQTFARLQESFEQISRFTADASHELKTPLALVRLNAERLRQRLGHDPESTGALDDILEEMARLQNVIDRLLFLAQARSGELAAELRPIQTAQFVADFAADAAALAEDREVRFSVVRNEPGTARAEPDLLRQMLLNLVSNAVSVSAAGALVTLESDIADNVWKLVVTDEGPGLPADQLELIFGRFVRYAPTQSGAERTGHGLGLAISKSIVELHGGNIRAENRTDRRGLRLIVDLPAGPV
jgi:signal transduction histidine kinase